MKIQLERRLTSCPDNLRCTACNQMFGVGQIRLLLRNDRGLIQGDVCPDCSKLKPSEVKQKMANRAAQLIQQSAQSSSEAVFSRQRALELLETSKEAIERPTFWQWILKRLEIFSQESQELELARFGLSSCACRSRWHNFSSKEPRLRIVFEDGFENSFEDDLEEDSN